MPALVELHSVSCAALDGHLLFENLDLVFGAERCGLIGRNGVGKSTLLGLIAGDHAPHGGRVHRHARIGWLRQQVGVDAQAIVADALGVAESWARLARLDAGTGTPEDLIDVDWNLPLRIAAALEDVGLAHVDPMQPLMQLSGGQRTRAALAALRLDDAELLLLDEPSNNLDADARALLAHLLADRRGGAIVVSHDRNLLRSMDRIVELSAARARSYGGGYALYSEQRALERAAADRALADAGRDEKRIARERQEARERQQKRDARGQRARARNDQPRIVLGLWQDGSERSSARNERLGERLLAQAASARDAARREVEQHTALDAALPACGLDAGTRVLAFEDVDYAWPGAPPLLHGIRFEIRGPERIAIIGGNGVGKSTLLRLAAGELEPTRGHIIRGAHIALLDQHAALLDRASSVIDNFRALNPDDDETACRSALARFLFRTDAALKRVADLSGGETLRAALACVLGGRRPPQLLILDEPTNHLDLDSIAAIESALDGYDGALLVASHDTEFLSAIGIERHVDVAACVRALRFPGHSAHTDGSCASIGVAVPTFGTAAAAIRCDDRHLPRRRTR